MGATFALLALIHDDGCHSCATFSCHHLPSMHTLKPSLIGFDAMVVACLATLKAARAVARQSPGVKISVFSDRDLSSQRARVEAELDGADVFFGSLLFDFDQVCHVACNPVREGAACCMASGYPFLGVLTRVRLKLRFKSQRECACVSLASLSFLRMQND